MTIQNTPPGVPIINITPLSPDSSQDVICNVTTNSTDIDNNPVNYTFYWTRGNNTFREFGPSSQTYDILPSTSTSDGQYWNCTVVPYDGISNGTIAWMQFYVGDAPPWFSSNGTNNTTPYYRDTILIYTKWTDDINLSTAILQINSTGSFVNLTYMDMTGTSMWSNFTLNTSDYMIGSIWWRIIANDSGGNWNVSMSPSLVTIVDNENPGIGISSIANFSSTSNITLEFNLTDNYKIYAPSLLINISNSTDSTYHTLVNSSAYSLSGLVLANNATCINYSNILYTCSLTLNLTDNHYNITFLVNDTSGNQNITVLMEYLVDTRAPNVTAVYEGYYDGNIHLGDHSPVNTLFANWSYQPDTGSGINRFEYAIGTEAYPTDGWNNVRNWTSTNLTNNVNITLNLTHNERYYFNVRAVDNVGLYSTVVSSDGIFYEDDSPPVCPGWNPATGDGCIHDDGDWTNINTSLHAYWNFTDNGSMVVLYRYAVGTQKYPTPGWDNVVAATETTNPFAIVQKGVHFVSELVYNQTYYWNVQARNENPTLNGWSPYRYSNGIVVDTVPPYNGSITYTPINTTLNITTVTLKPGKDDVSQLGYALLQQSRSLINPSSHACSGFSEYYTINNSNSLITPINVVVPVEHGYCYKFRYVVYDNAGNSRTYYYSSQLYFYVDSTPPNPFNTTIAATDGFIFDPILSIDWEDALDEETGVSYYTYSVYIHYDNGTDGELIKGPTNTTLTSAIVDSGNWGRAITHLDSVIAYVTACNSVALCTTSTSNIVTYKDDQVPDPVVVVSVDSDTNGSDAYGWWDNTNDGITNINVTSNEPTLYCYYSEYDLDYVNAEEFGKPCYATGASSTQTNLTCNVSVSQGRYTYHISCWDDNLGKQSENENTDVSFLADWGGPAITITKPISGYNITGLTKMNISAFVSDAGANVSDIWYELVSYDTGEVADRYENVTRYSVVNSTFNATTNITTNVTINYTINKSTIMVNRLNYTINWTENISIPYKGNYLFVVYANDTIGQAAVGYVPLIVNNRKPTITSVRINSTSGKNYTYDNLTFYAINESDLDGDSVNSIFNWFVNNKSLAAISLQFKGNSTTGLSFLNGSVKDYSGYNNNGIVVGATWSRRGGYHNDTSYRFDGINDYILVNDSSSLDLNETTIYVIFRTSDASKNQTIISKWSDMAVPSDNRSFIVRTEASRVVFSVSSNGEIGGITSIAGNTALQDDSWYTLAAVYDGNYLRIYLNGASDATPVSYTQDIYAGESPLMIGQRGDNSEYFQGYLDQAFIFNRALTPEQIAAAYNNVSDILYSETSKGDTWYVSATPNDGYTDGVTKYSNNLTIPLN